MYAFGTYWMDGPKGGGYAYSRAKVVEEDSARELLGIVEANGLTNVDYFKEKKGLLPTDFTGYRLRANYKTVKAAVSRGTAHSL